MGRPHGSQNVLLGDTKQSIASVYNHLGGGEALLRWAKKNQTEYYRMLVAILPKEQKIEFVNPLMTIGAEDIARLILTFSRARGIAVPSAIERIAAPETGTVQTVRETESIS